MAEWQTRMVQVHVIARSWGFKSLYPHSFSLWCDMDKQFYKTFLNIAWPIALQNLVGAALNLIDTLMIGGLGEASVAAVGIANRLFFFFIVSIFGIYSACGIFAAQFWGKKDLLNLHRMMGIMASIALPFSLIFSAVALIIPEQYIFLFQRDITVIGLGASYLKIIAPSYIFMAFSFLYSFTSRTIHRTKAPMFISLFALSINTILNYSLIYGHFGAPKMGVEGAATATLIARIIELMLYFVLINAVSNHPLKTKLSEMFSFSKGLFKDVIKRGTPVFINEMIWSLGHTVLFIAYGFLGTAAIAVAQIAEIVTDIFISFFVGVSSACGVMIGNVLGVDKFDLAESYAKRFSKITIFLAAIASVVIVGLAFIIPNFYAEFSASTRHLLMLTIIVSGLFHIPRMYNFVVFVGILRSGGDTLFCVLLDMISVLLIGIPLAFIIVLFFPMPIYKVIAIVSLGEIILLIAGYLRVKKKKWLCNVVEKF